MKQTDALVLLNAYRMGSVPQRIDIASIDRPHLQSRYEDFFSSIISGPQTLLVEGDYGSGKSHALCLAKYQALEQGYIACHLTLDIGINLSKPDDLYYHIMHNLYSHHTSIPSSFEDLFELWIDNLKNAPNKQLAANDIKWVIDDMTKYHNLFSQVFLNYIRASLIGDMERSRQIAAWLMGDPHMSAALKKEIGIIGSIDKLVALDFLKAFLHLIHLMGFKGMLLLIDELDLLVTYRSDVRERAFASLRQLIDDQYNGSLNHLSLILAGTPRVFRDTTTGFASYPPLAQRLRLDPLHSSLGAPLINLTQTTLEELYTLSTHLMSVYQQAYSCEHLPDDRHTAHLTLMNLKKDTPKLADITLRRFIQHFIMLLDDMRKKPHQKLYAMKMDLTLKVDGTMHFTSKL
jgi:hypothetical protein